MREKKAAAIIDVRQPEELLTDGQVKLKPFEYRALKYLIINCPPFRSQKISR